MDFSEKWGKDVDEAVKLALAELKLTIDDVDVTVLEESSKGFFGLGSKLAKVRVEKKKGQKAEKAVKEAKEAKEVKELKEAKEVKEEPKPFKETPRKEEKRPIRQEKRETTRPVKIEKKPDERVNLEKTDDHPALLFVRELADKMELELEIKAMKNEECVYIDIEGKDSGTIIGKRGQTLDSIQYLASLVANKDKEKYIRVVVDAENYRNKRERTLEMLAERLAGKVVSTRRSVRLEPMNPYERKIIHAKLQSNPKVTTRSEGEEPYRRVIIEYK